MKKRKNFKRKPRKPLLAPNVRNVDYKNVELLEKFINNQGKIMSSKMTGLSRLQQLNIARAIKRARFLALLPYSKDRARKF